MARHSIPSVIEKNKRQTKILLISFLFLIMILGLFLGVVSALAFDLTLEYILIMSLSFLSVSAIYSFFSYRSMNKILSKRSNAIEVREEDNPMLYHIVEDMAIVANIPTPKVYIIDDPAPNAFASGKDPENSMIAVTTGLLDLLNREELEGVIAHETAHIMNYDIKLRSFAVILVGFVVGTGVFIVNMGLAFLRSSVYMSSSSRKKNEGKLAFMLFAIGIIVVGWIIRLIGVPIAKIIQFAISREREFLADTTGAKLTQNPQGLINALVKIDGCDILTNTPNSAVSALYISTPKALKPKKNFYNRLYSSHPETKERIENLSKLMQ